MTEDTAIDALRDLANEMGFDIAPIDDCEPTRPRIRRCRLPDGGALTPELSSIAIDTAWRIELALAAPTGYKKFRERVYQRWYDLVLDLASADADYWFTATPGAKRIHRLRHSFQRHWSRVGYAARLRAALANECER